MRLLFVFVVFFYSFHATAGINKCKDKDGKVTYQEMPCVTGEVSTIKKAPEPTEDEKIRARSNLDTMIQKNKNFEASQQMERQQRLERIKQEEEAQRRLLLEQESRAQAQRNQQLLERQAAAAERAARAAEDANRRELKCRRSYGGDVVCR